MERIIEIDLNLPKWTEMHAVKLEFTKPAKPTQNTFIECFNQTYGTEIIEIYQFRTMNKVRGIMERRLSEFNCARPHKSLNNLTPKEYQLRQHITGVSKIAWN